MTGRTRPLGTIPGLLELAEAQHGAVARNQLRELGVTRSHVRSQFAAQRWQPVGPHVVALMTGPLDAEQRRWAGVLHTSPDGLLSDLTCLEVHGLTGWETGGIDVLLPHGRRTAPWNGVVLRRSRDIPAEDRCVRRGLRCTTPERAVLDAASRIGSPRAAAGLVLAVVQQRVTTVEAIGARLERDTSSRRNAATIRDALASAHAGADSLAEVDVMDLLHRAGLVRIRRQVLIRTPRGRRPVDVLVELPDGSLLAIEVDGVHHADPAVRAVDAEKDAALLAAGIPVIRIPVQWLRSDPEAVLALLRQIAFGSAIAG